jgi:hypothetical protein
MNSTTETKNSASRGIPVTLVIMVINSSLRSKDFNPNRVSLLPTASQVLIDLDQSYRLIRLSLSESQFGIKVIRFMWRPHGSHRETYGCPDPTPFSTRSPRSRRMIRPFRSPLFGASHHLPPWCALLAPNQLPVSHLASNSRPDPTQTTTTPILPALFFAPPSLPQAFVITPTPFA